MSVVPELETKRLLLREFLASDKFVINDLTDDKEIAATTLRIPHPYSLSDAEEWLTKQREDFEKGESVHWAICPKDLHEMIGSIGLKLKPKFDLGEIGFWIGKSYWGNGFASEATSRVVNYGFDELDLNRIEGYCMVENKASARILEKFGMQYEGLHRQFVKKWDEYKDVKSYAVLKSDR